MRRRRRVNIKTASVRRLREDLARAQLSLSAAESASRAEQEAADSAPARCKALQEEKERHLSSKPKTSTIAILLANKNNPSYAEYDAWYNRLKQLERDIERTHTEGQLVPYRAQRVDRLRSWSEHLQEEIARKERKKQRLADLRAAAAATSELSRAVGDSVRTQMSKQSQCPYCGQELGASPHADHIYPVAKGGRSTPGNMVWVCQACNVKKAASTLAAFIAKFALDRNEIESRLSLLGKDF